MNFISKIFKKLSNNFFKGILISVPVIITFYIAWGLIKFFDKKASPLLGTFPYEIPGFGLIFVFIFFSIIGFLTTGILGRLFSSFVEKILSKIPVLRNIYSGLKQLFETVLSKKSNSFREVVLIEYPRKGIWAMGFLTGDTKGEVNRKTNDNLVNIFLPTTPNPTSGFLLFLPRKDVIRLSMSVEEGIKMIISAGMLTPSENQKKIKSLKKNNK
ncbi:MAG: hypothetical protein CFH26_00624 [Alphaproteobacteria bacterium MarineAlpha6_Bin4]|nr:MAG: hypothetical protein CFH25_00675 [Alphaproteobacteria bacterium MarineAlpha6_Bin3]PPR37628.1 MAG: hypothetical protein CFH26_00624 [Alphaproteobacteria bacterium MarineAlpha6_Bin4]|tara:strand:+ start:18629 stop:19270 length:642 start_codon:yes stop_codon:yes gene_type:complete